MKNSITNLLKNKNFTWNMIGITINAFYPLILIIFITRFNGISASGLFSFTFYLVSLLSVISSYGGRIYQISDVKTEYADNHYVSLRYISSFLMICVTLILFVVNSYYLTKMLLILSFLVFRIIEAIADSYYGIMQKNDNLKSVGKSFVFKSLLSILLFILLDILTKNILISSFSFIISNLLIFQFYDKKIVSRYTKLVLKVDRNVIILLKKCFPIFIFSFFQFLLLNITRYMVDIYLSEEIQGYFGIIIAPAAMISLLAQFLIQPFIKSLSELNHKKEYITFKKNVRRLCLYLIGAGIISSLLMYLIGGQILSYVYSLDLLKFRGELTLIVIGGTFSGVTFVYSTMLTILRSFKNQLYIYIVSFIITVILSLTLITSFGLNGALLAFSLSTILQSLLFWIVYVYKIKKI